MNHFKQYLLCAAASLCGIVSAQAQQNSSKIIGYVFDPDNNPALYSTVILMNSDSVFMKGTLSSTEGFFELEKINPGNYLVMVRNVEFTTWVSDPLTIGKGDIIELDRISLSTNVNELNEVVVTGRKALVEVHPDKLVFNVSQSVNASGSSAMEVVGKAPGVVVDMDNNIILQGKSGVQVYINGRPTRLSGNDVANLLEGMRSDNIESIEVITNPSAKYEAEGTAGIINIVLKKNVQLGTNGNVIASYSRGKYARSSGGSTLNYSGEKLSLFTNVNLSEDTYLIDMINTTSQNIYVLDKDERGVYRRRGYNLSAGMDYKFNDKHTVSLDSRVFINRRNNTINSTTSIIDTTGTNPPEFLLAETIDIQPTENFVANLNYRFIPNSNSSLSTDISIGRYASEKATEQPNDYYDSDMQDILRSVNSEYNSDTYIDLWSAMTDYEKKFSQITLSAGAKYSYVSTDNQLAFYNIIADAPVFDNTRSNDFTYEEKVAAVYFILNAKPTEKITLNAGLRMENTASLGRLVSDNDLDVSEVPRNYTDLFPNVSLSFDDQKNSVISASIGRRINRPNYQYLNPFEYRSSELTAYKGNPFLKPNYISNYQLTYAFKRKLVITNTYSITRDFFANIFIISEEKGNILTPRNMQKATNYSLSVSYPMKVTDWYEFASFAVYNYETYDGDMEGTVIDLSANTYNIRLQNNFRLPAGITMELTLMHNSPSIWRGSIEVEAFSSVNFGIRKDFLDRKLQIQITGSDIFRTGSDYHYKSNYGGMIVSGIRSFDGQRFGISGTYNFGNDQAKAKARRKSAIDSELNRITD
ncbi:MAG: TonB-dependent receptor [Candidatus Desulfacyla sp.]